MEKIYEDTFSQDFLSDFSSAAWILAPILPWKTKDIPEIPLSDGKICTIRRKDNEILAFSLSDWTWFIEYVVDVKLSGRKEPELEISLRMQLLSWKLDRVWKIDEIQYSIAWSPLKILGKDSLPSVKNILDIIVAFGQSKKEDIFLERKNSWLSSQEKKEMDEILSKLDSAIEKSEKWLLDSSENIVWLYDELLVLGTTLSSLIERIEKKFNVSYLGTEKDFVKDELYRANSYSRQIHWYPVGSPYSLVAKFRAQIERLKQNDDESRIKDILWSISVD